MFPFSKIVHRSKNMFAFFKFCSKFQKMFAFSIFRLKFYEMFLFFKICSTLQKNFAVFQKFVHRSKNVQHFKIIIRYFWNCPRSKTDTGFENELCFSRKKRYLSTCLVVCTKGGILRIQIGLIATSEKMGTDSVGRTTVYAILVILFVPILIKKNLKLT